MKTTLHRKSPSAQQRRAALCVMGVLACIAMTMLVLQGRYDPRQWREQPEDRHQQTSTDAADDPDSVPGLVPLSGPERYTADTLSDKINGKAELYLNAGFKALDSRRFALDNDTGRWMERYVYTMDGHRNAYSVFSRQRRRGSTPAALTGHAYVASNGLFFVHGPYYVEIVAGEDSEDMRSALNALGSAFVESHAVAAGSLPALDLFPPENRVGGAETLIADSAFGLEQLDWVYTAAYASGDHQATAFIVPGASAGRAAELADMFIGYWMEYGGQRLDPPDSLAGARMVSILDTVMIAVVYDTTLFGVHEATQLDFGVTVAERLQRTVEGGAHASP